MIIAIKIGHKVLRGPLPPHRNEARRLANLPPEWGAGTPAEWPAGRWTRCKSQSVLSTWRSRTRLVDWLKVTSCGEEGVLYHLGEEVLRGVMISLLYTIAPEQEGLTLAALLRLYLPRLSWSQIRRRIELRQVRLRGELCLDPARRVHAGELVEILDQPAPPRQRQDLHLRYVDEHLVVVEKPAGVSTVRHPSERDWSRRRKELSPTLEDLLPAALARREGRRRKGPLPRLRVVQRLDKETSGLVVFARTVLAERGLGRQFHDHTVTRRYLALIPGFLAPQRVASYLIRDRGDGRRGSTRISELGKEAITHLDVVERLPGFTLMACRLETGRTHQIRIHLAELGHPVCGDKVYCQRPDGSVFEDRSGAPRLALHAAELGFIHPDSQEPLHWSMPLPEDLEALMARLRGDTDPGKG